MNTKLFIVMLVQKFWPEEYDVAGKANVVDIVEDDVDFAHAVNGDWIDPSTAIASVMSVVLLLKVCIEVYEKLTVHLKRVPTKAEVKQEVMLRLPQVSGTGKVLHEDQSIDKAVEVICEEYKTFEISTDQVK